MNPELRVSVIIPTYNRKNVIYRAIQSVLSQSYSNYEIIIVDDNSSDGTDKIILKEYPQIRLIVLDRNVGPAEARNIGIKAASGEIIAFLDSDDEWEPDFLKEQVCTMHESEAVLAYCNFIKIHLDSTKETSNTTPRCYDKDYLIEEFLMRNPIRTLSIVIARKDALLRSGLFDKALIITEDRDLYLRMLSEGQFVHTPKYLVKRYVSCDALTRNYRLWGKHLFITLNKFFADNRNVAYKKIKNTTLVNAALQVSQFSIELHDYVYGLRKYCLAFYYSIREYNLFLKFIRNLINIFYNHFIPLKLKTYVNQVYIDRIKKYETPASLVFFVTTKCNAKCTHCFYWKNINIKKDELSIQEITKLISSLRTKTNVSLTGGDPFLRYDFYDICRLLANDKNVESITINTNGIKSNVIYSTCKKIIDETDLKNLTVIVSLDGLSATHDKIRGVLGCFDKAVETIKLLAELTNTYNAITVQVLTVLMKENMHEIAELMNYLKIFNIEHKFSFARGAYSTYSLSRKISSDLHPDEKVMNILSIDEMDNILREILKNDPFLSKRQLDKLKLSIDIVKRKKRIIPCYAGKINGVIYSNGDVSFCEQVLPVGNIRDADYDLKRLWNSSRADELRNKIQKCECIHGCNLTTSLSIHPRTP